MFWRLSWVMVTLTAMMTDGCKTGVVDPGYLDGQAVADRGAPDRHAGDRGPPSGDGAPGSDLTTKAGDPCTLGKCGANLICMANVCHRMCTGECGGKASECKSTDGCHWVTSFSAACMPGTRTYLQSCGAGRYCLAELLCVNVANKGGRCLKLCKNGCPSNSYCGSTSNGCKVCIQ